MNPTGDWRIDLITLIVVVISLVTAVVGLVTAFHTARKATAKIEEIHLAVNSNLRAVTQRVEQLTKALERADVDVPDKPKDLDRWSSRCEPRCGVGP